MCVGCMKLDCGACRSCKDKMKLGGKNKRRQACKNRECITKIEYKQEQEYEENQEQDILEITISDAEDEINREDQESEKREYTRDGECL